MSLKYIFFFEFLSSFRFFPLASLPLSASFLCLPSFLLSSFLFLLSSFLYRPFLFRLPFFSLVLIPIAASPSSNLASPSPSESDWIPSALIDFGDAKAGDPLWDLIPLYASVFRCKKNLLKVWKESSYLHVSFDAHLITIRSF